MAHKGSGGEGVWSCVLVLQTIRMLRLPVSKLTFQVN